LKCAFLSKSDHAHNAGGLAVKNADNYRDCDGTEKRRHSSFLDKGKAFLRRHPAPPGEKKPRSAGLFFVQQMAIRTVISTFPQT